MPRNDLTPLDDFLRATAGPQGERPQGEWIDPPKANQVHPGLEFLALLMDDMFIIPGTPFKFGLDGIIGLIPVVGDLVSFLIAGVFLQEAERLGVSRWTKAKMIGNSTIDLVVGAIPLVGDVFDFGFKANRRNLQLLQEHVKKNSGVIDITPKDYSIDWLRAIAAALLAAAAITIYMLTIPTWVGVPQMDIGLAIGGLFDADGGPLATFGRLAWRLGNGVLCVLVYVAALKLARRQSSAITGAIFGVLVWFAGPMLLVPATLNLFGVDNPGLFMVSLGWGVMPALIDLGAHLIHGLIAGAIYRHRVS